MQYKAIAFALLLRLLALQSCWGFVTANDGAISNNSIRVVGGSSLSSLSSSSTSTMQSQPSETPIRVVIAGGGPCGMFLAGLLLQQNAASGRQQYQIHLLEQSPRNPQNGNAFGMGLSPRLIHALTSLPGLAPKVLSVGKRVDALTEKYAKNSAKNRRKNKNKLSNDDDNDEVTTIFQDFEVKIASRQNICEQMMQYLEETYPEALQDGTLKVSYGEGCQNMSIKQKQVTTSKKQILSYDLLVAADGVNSKIRQKLVERRGLSEAHYISKLRWKALELPPQPDLTAGSFKRLAHPSFFGQVLPQYPEGHIALLFYTPSEDTDADAESSGNPQDIHTAEDLRAAMTDALQDKQVADNKKGKKSRDLFGGVRRLLGMNREKDINHSREVILDDARLEQCIEARPGLSHVMYTDRFHDAPAGIALIGDAAHGMYSLLGQGCACGLQSTMMLADCLGASRQTNESGSLETALEAYSAKAVPEAHAITDLNLITHAIMGGGLKTKFQVFPRLLWQTLRGKALMGRVGKYDIPYSQLLDENKRIIEIAKKRWEDQRVDYVPRPTTMLEILKVR